MRAICSSKPQSNTRRPLLRIAGTIIMILGVHNFERGFWTNQPERRKRYRQGTRSEPQQKKGDDISITSKTYEVPKPYWVSTQTRKTARKPTGQRQEINIIIRGRQAENPNQKIRGSDTEAGQEDTCQQRQPQSTWRLGGQAVARSRQHLGVQHTSGRILRMVNNRGVRAMSD